MNSLQVQVGIFALCAMLGCAPRTINQAASKSPETPKFDSPQACIDAQLRAAKAQDDSAMLLCLTPAARNQTVGWLAYQVEQEVFHRTKKKDQAIAVLEAHDLHDFDIMGHMQLHDSPGGKGAGYALHLAGARIKDKPQFVRAAKKLLGNARTAGPHEATLVDVRIDGEIATASLKSGKDELAQPVVLRKINGSWLIATGKDEFMEPAQYTRQQRDAMQALGDKGVLAFDEATGELESFYFYDMSATDEDLAPIQYLTTLPSVTLWRTQISDRGLEFLKTLGRMRELSLRGTKITDAGLDRLYGHTQLKSLDLMNTLVSDDAIARLRAKLPACDVRVGFELPWIHGESPLESSKEGWTVLVRIAAADDESTTALDKFLNCREVYELVETYRIRTIVVYSREVATLSWLKNKQLPQIAVFAPGSDQPKLLADDFTVDQLLEAIEIAGPSRFKLESVIQ